MRLAAPAALALLAPPAAAAAADLQVAALADLSLEQLGDIRVTSVSRRPQAVAEAAASVFVISGEDIRRSAATSLPEALRLAPNLQVARLNAGQYAISARGFNDAIGNKLLVLLDGRTIYSPLFSGVFWDAHDVVLQDVERIEVISGPGATLYGANAVNGVINIITRAAGDTQGVLAYGRGGQEGSEATLRYGGRVGGGHWRLYGTRLNRNNTYRRDGSGVADASSKEQVGFRADWAGATDSITLQGDAYRAGEDLRNNQAPELAGGNLLGRWRREHADGSAWQWQAYVDQARREDDLIFRDRSRTFDLEFIHTLAPAGRHTLVWGAGHRRSRSKTEPTAFVRFVPETRDLSWTHVFVQDEIRLGEPLRLTLGAKLEHNDYTGLEFLPTLRAAYDLGGTRLLWGALSRAVRAPARLDRDFFFPAEPPFLIGGGPDFESEVANVAELGYRAQANAALSYSLTAFFHDYHALRGGGAAPTSIENRAWGKTWGLEGWGEWQLRRGWQLRAGFVELRKSLKAATGSGPGTLANLGNDPEHQWRLGSRADLPGDVQFDLTVRHVSALPEPRVEAYTATDLRLAWQPRPGLTVALLVQNLFDAGHIEFFAPAMASEVPRSAFLALEWRMP